MVVALDRLQAMAPKVESVSLVVAWFGDDLRAGDCNPAGRRGLGQDHEPADWSVNGVSRAAAISSAATTRTGRSMAARRPTSRWCRRSRR